MMKKWITTAVLVALALATECVKGQDDINPRSRGRRVSYCGKMFVSPVVLRCISDHNPYHSLHPQSYKLSITSLMKGQVDDPNQKNKFFLTKEDVKGSTRGRYTRKPRQPSRSKSDEKEEVLVNASPLLPKKTSIDKPESVGVLSNDKEQESTT